MTASSRTRRQVIGRLAGWRILGSTTFMGAFAGGILWHLAQEGAFHGSAHETRVAITLIIVALFSAWSAGLYFAALILNRGCGLYEQDGRIVHLFPFSRSLRCDEITSVTLGPDLLVVGWPRHIVLRGGRDQRMVIPCMCYGTSFREMAARLGALGLAVADDPRLKVDPFAREGA